MASTILLIAFLLTVSQFNCCKGFKIGDEDFNFTTSSFPKDFIFSTATASYQVEGAWNISGKGENIWDHICHENPTYIKDEDSGDIACDSYHKYKEDVQNIKKIGFKMYRFSLSWSRLFPKGFIDKVNPDGVRYYNELIDDLILNGIEPMVTLYHWDLPQPLEDLGGWLNQSIPEIFGDYARAVFKLFGNNVKWWITINEPLSIVAGYGGDAFAPARHLHGIGDYKSGHNILKAHAEAYRIYDKEFRKSQGGKVSISLNGAFHLPKDPNNPEDVEAAERGNQFQLGWFGHPIFSETGDYPPVMREYVDRNSLAEGRLLSRLPYFTDDEILQIKGTFDYLGLNHYSSVIAQSGKVGENPSVQRDSEVIVEKIPGSNQSACFWLQSTPKEFRLALNWFKSEYNNPELFITENGYCDEGESKDLGRIYYYSAYLDNLSLAINKDHCNVIGYTVWSLMDNFEWRDGFTKKFGLIEIDFQKPNRPRILKLSATFFRRFLNAVSKENGD